MTQIKENPITYTTPTYLSTTQAAERLALTQQTIKAFCNSGELQNVGIKVIKIGEGIGGDWRISQDDINALFGTEPALTPEFIAEKFSFNVKSVRNMCKSGKIPATKIGRSWRIPASVVAAMEKS